LGLAHSYSRAKVKFNIHKVDNMIIQAIAILDQLDKDLNTFCMRIREWYSWHFPELIQVVKDNYQYARLTKLIQNKSLLNEASLPSLTEITMDEEKSKQIVAAAKMSMGTDIHPADMANIEQFAIEVIKLAEYRTQLYDYLCKKMSDCAPNLTSLIGEQVGARLISHAGSLTNLAKYPASTVQILGAEKALFRALKTRGKTPKYGLIFHSSFIGRAGAKNKGRMSRYVANKISLASRIDSFADVPSSQFGEVFKKQVEERLEFYKSGAVPRKNVDVMKEALELMEKAKEEKVEEGGKARTKRAASEPEPEADKPKKKKKAKVEAPAVDEAVPEAEPKKKKKKKDKAEAAAVVEDVPQVVEKNLKRRKRIKQQSLMRKSSCKGSCS